MLPREGKSTIDHDALQTLAERLAARFAHDVDVTMVKGRLACSAQARHQGKSAVGLDGRVVRAADARRLLYGDAEAISHVAAPRGAHAMALIAVRHRCQDVLDRDAGT